MKIISANICLLIIATFFSACTNQQKKIEIKNDTIFEFPETSALVEFIDSAVILVQEQGEAAFPEFRVKDGNWFQGDRYIFIWDLDGMRYVYPPDPDGEGRNMLDLTDINGKPIGRLFISAVENDQESGWVHYQWPRPGSDLPVWKSTYLSKAITPDNKAFLVGSGVYDLKTDKIFLIDAVNKAIGFLQTNGLEAADSFRSETSEFRFLDSYIFIKDFEGNEIFNAAFPEMENTNLIDLSDHQGKHFIKEEIEILQTDPSCWMEYQWPRPGEEKPVRKIVYLEKADIRGRLLIIGAGTYRE